MRKKKLVVIGKNSSIFKDLKNETEFFKHCTELSHTGDFSVCENSYVVIFSVDKKKFAPNDWMLDRIKSVNPYFVILISSMSVIVAQKGFNYKYPRIKHRQEIKCRDLFGERLCVMRLGSYYSSKNKKIRSPDLKTGLEDFYLALKKVLDTPEPNNMSLINLFIREHAITTPLKLYLGVLIFLGPLSVFLRPLDIIIKLCTNKTYGYSLLSFEFAKDY